MIFSAMRENFGEEWYGSISSQQWIIWRKHINTQLFENDIIASEAISVIPGMDKRQWPQGTGFFSRVRDLCLLARKTHEQVVKVNEGPKSLKDFLAERVVDK